MNVFYYVDTILLLKILTHITCFDLANKLFIKTLSVVQFLFILL